ncbi:MAG: flippase-like domain-containing protein [Burkholderiaceae bacterium]|nr:flippase-like domain-containing protein [Burkholderiaceae bacterium]
MPAETPVGFTVAQPGTIKRLIKPALGLGLLLLVISQLQAEKLKSAFFSANWAWFAVALMLALLANMACALRWRKIVADFGLQISTQSAMKLYFQGVTANTVLPGGIIGGDIWRTVGLVRSGMTRMVAAQTVFFDRVSGFWSLAVIAVLALGLTWADQLIQAPAAILGIYGSLMLSIALGPVVLMRVKAARSPLLFRIGGLSLLSQVLTIAAFAGCLWSVGVSVNLLALAAICAGIFLGAVVPASIGGFGSREVASLAFLATLGIASEAAFLASVLFGLTATLQGLVSLPTLIKQNRPR